MDQDRFVVQNLPTWKRLGDLANKNTSDLSADEIATFINDYQLTATHLSMARTVYNDPDLTTRLSGIVANAGKRLYRPKPQTWSGLWRSIWETFPAAFWYLRWHIAAMALLFLTVAVIVGVWTANDPQALEAAIPEHLREYLLDGAWVEYYSNTPSPVFAAEVGANNIRIGFLVFGGGILLAIPMIYILVVNAVHLGFAAGMFYNAGVEEVFWGYITPHGLLELTAVFIAAGTGLALGTSWVVPGDKSRSRALQEAAGRSIVVVVGLIGVFGVAAFIEGFITGSGAPTWLRVGIGVLAEVGFLLYALGIGRNAAANGLSGLLIEAERVDE